MFEWKCQHSGYTRYVVQRGIVDRPCFFVGDDYRSYLQCLHEVSLAHDCMIHAYALLENTVHLLMTSTAKTDIHWMMQDLDRNYVRHVSTKYDKNRVLWAGSSKKIHVRSDKDILEFCFRIEQCPVGVGQVRYASQYRWSSFLRNAMGCSDPLVQPHDSYWVLGETDNTRQQAYRNLFRQYARGVRRQVVKDSHYSDHAL